MEASSNWNSSLLTEGKQEGIKAFYWGLGWDEKDFKKPQVGIGIPLLEANLCNLHAQELSDLLKQGLQNSRIHGFGFGTPSVSDNITQGHEGGNASLPSRNIIANCAEMVATAHHFDGLIGLHLCDKNGPGFAMAMLRSNLPGFILSGGTIKPGCLNGRSLTIQDPYDTQAAVAAGQATKEELDAIVRSACPGPGGCGIAASFNTWGMAMEALGLMPPYSSSNPAEDAAKQTECRQAGIWMRRILKKGLRPRDVVTKQSLGNATVMIGAAGGSTNGLLHLLAVAKEAEIDFTLRDMQAILRETPVYCNFAPRGKGTMIDLHNMGGTPMLIRRFIEIGLLDGSLKTLFADSLESQVIDACDVPADQDLIAPTGKPFKAFADAQICFGNLAPDGIVFKVCNQQDPHFEGTAICFEEPDDILAAVAVDKIQPGHAVILRGWGPVAKGMPEVLVASSALASSKLDGKVAFISDARISGVSHGAIGIHCAPEAAADGPIGKVQDGDPISFDLLKGEIHWTPQDPAETTQNVSKPYSGKHSYLREFAASSRQASEGCISRF